MKRTLRHSITLAAVAVFALGIATSAARAGLRPDLFPPGGVGGIEEIPDPIPGPGPGGIPNPPATPEPATLVMGLTAVGLMGLRKLRARKHAGS
jgi:hypothetical protein